MTNNINFKAQFIKPVLIDKTRSSNGYSKCLASFVEINQKNIDDLKAIEALKKEWKGYSNYIKNIFYSIFTAYSAKSENPISNIYALTTQLSGLDKLKASDIQGVIEIIPSLSANKDLYITYFQINPQNVYSSQDRIYSKLGTHILNTIKQLFPQKKISTITGNKSQIFYIKNGFKEKDCGLLEFEPK